MLAKAELKDAIAAKNRGLSASVNDKAAILAAIARLEGCNPTPRPLEAPELLEGDWRLLYTSSQELLGIDRFPLLRLGQIYQCVRTAEAKIYNIAEVTSLPLLEGMVSVAARFDAVSTQRVNVKFERGVLALQRLLDYRSPSQLIQRLQNVPKLSLLQAIDFSINSDRQQGWLEITYLDADMRLGRGNEGSVFVLSKVGA
ncbi:MAG: fibrillin [Leptolyngbyaceae cyanobacterium SM1_1_3]|nr:fibrillin [Leptolyngbyaceae cyanobacterium SM1_1_3]NJN03265.1 fibrillin [Leptolyngbyaceae cyanobacterium RM1_1_2]NJO11978.1 fibrillin [Leptolyngbyaceae cyanobacterium SL_1_1]